jgi:hypothetical protein
MWVYTFALTKQYYSYQTDTRSTSDCRACYASVDSPDSTWMLADTVHLWGTGSTVFQGSMSWECTRFDGEYKQGKCTVQLMVTNDMMDVGRARVIVASIASVQARRYV